MQYQCSKCGKTIYGSEPEACPYCGHNDFLTEEERDCVYAYRKQLEKYKVKVSHEIELGIVKKFVDMFEITRSLIRCIFSFIEMHRMYNDSFKKRIM